MLKIIGFGLLLCIGGAIVFALYAAYRITKMGQAMGRRDYSNDDSSVHHNGYITTTGTTIHEPDQFRHAETPQYGEDARDSGPGADAGEAVGSSVGDTTVDFGSTDNGGDAGSSDSGSSDSGSSDSGGGDFGGGSND